MLDGGHTSSIRSHNARMVQDGTLLGKRHRLKSQQGATKRSRTAARITARAVLRGTPKLTGTQQV